MSSTRRWFLATTAAAIAVPATAFVSKKPDDPILSVLEKRGQTEKAYGAACAEQSRREGILITEGIGLRPFVTLVWGGTPFLAYTHAQIDAHASAVADEVIALGHVELDAVLARYEAILGNAEDEAGKLGDIDMEAFDQLLDTVPTTALGLSKLLSYLTEEAVDVGYQLDRFNIERLLSCIDESVRSMLSTDVANA